MLIPFCSYLLLSHAFDLHLQQTLTVYLLQPQHVLDEEEEKANELEREGPSTYTVDLKQKPLIKFNPNAGVIYLVLSNVIKNQAKYKCSARSKQESLLEQGNSNPPGKDAGGLNR